MMQHLCCHDVGGNINATKKNTGAVLTISKEVCVKVNTELTKYVYMSHHHSARENHDNVKNDKFKMGVTVTEFSFMMK